MHIYNLDDANFFSHDVEEICDRISTLYDIDFNADPFSFKTKIKLDKNVHWASPKSADSFNKMIPPIKSLIKDMYSIIESLYVSALGKFDKPNAELKYKGLKELRLLNNKLKHFKTKEVEISLISVILIEDCVMDFLIQYKYPDTLDASYLSDLIRPFLIIMEDLEVISINRENK